MRGKLVIGSDDKINKWGFKVESEAVKFESDISDSAKSFNIPGGSLGIMGPPIETADKYSTGLSQKRVNFPAFMNLIRNQFDHGGAKYASGSKDKEFTDLICEAFPGESGVDWVLGTCMKYMGRYKNFRREKDLLKVATYMYLLWLKGGFHLTPDHDEDTKVGGVGMEHVDPVATRGKCAACGCEGTEDNKSYYFDY